MTDGDLRREEEFQWKRHDFRHREALYIVYYHGDNMLVNAIIDR